MGLKLNATESTKSTSYMDCLLEMDNSGKLSTKLYDFDFPIVNVPSLFGNVPASPAYGVFVSQLVRYARACILYRGFILRARRLAAELLAQGCLEPGLVSAIREFYGRHYQLVASYAVSVAQFVWHFRGMLNGDFSARLWLAPVLAGLNGNMGGGDSGMAQDAYFFANALSYPRVSGIQIVFEFRGLMFLFGTSYVALFNGLMISDERILVPHVCCLLN